MSEALTLIPQFPLLPAFFTSFCLIYLLGYFAVFRRWSHTHRPDATSCFISLFHGTPAVFLAAAALLNAPFSFAAVNTPFQNLVLDFSIAYFTVDLLHYLVLLPADYHLFIAHHLATLFVFLTCRYVALHGAASLLVLLVIAELTSLFQNVWTLAGLRRYDVPLAEKICLASQILSTAVPTPPSSDKIHDIFASSSSPSSPSLAMMWMKSEYENLFNCLHRPSQLGDDVMSLSMKMSLTMFASGYDVIEVHLIPSLQ